MLRYPVLCCSGVQNKRLGVFDFSATCAEPGRANSREQNASATFEFSMERSASVRKKPLSIDPRIGGLTCRGHAHLILRCRRIGSRSSERARRTDEAPNEFFNMIHVSPPKESSLDDRCRANSA